MKKNLAVVVFILASFLSSAQDLTASFGYGSYDMTSLSNRQEMYVGLYYGKPKVIQNFPGYYYYDVSVAFPIVGRFSLGAAFSYFSTGGRIHYADQTGEVLVDHFVNGYYVAVHPRLKVFEDKGITVSLYGKDGLVFSNMRYEEMYRLEDETTRKSEDSETMGGSLEFGLIVSKKIIPHVYGQLSLGGHMNITPGEFTIEGNPNFYENIVICDWSGVRISGGIKFDLRR